MFSSPSLCRKLPLLLLLCLISIYWDGNRASPVELTNSTFTPFHFHSSFNGCQWGLQAPRSILSHFSNPLASFSPTPPSIIYGWEQIWRRSPNCPSTSSFCRNYTSFYHNHDYFAFIFPIEVPNMVSGIAFFFRVVTTNFPNKLEWIPACFPVIFGSTNCAKFLAAKDTLKLWDARQIALRNDSRNFMFPGDQCQEDEENVNGREGGNHPEMEFGRWLNLFFLIIPMPSSSGS